MNVQSVLRGLILDWLAERDDRCYWRQPRHQQQLPIGANVCLWQPDGKLGDAVIHTALVQCLQTLRPDLQLKIICSSTVASYWNAIPGIQVFQLPAGKARASDVHHRISPLDVFISLESFLSIDTVNAIRRIRPKITIGFNVAQYRIFDISLLDFTYSIPRRHISQRIHTLFEAINLEYDGRRPNLTPLAHVDVSERVPIKANKFHVFLNVAGAAKNRTFNRASIEKIINTLKGQHPTARILLSAPKQERADWEQWVSQRKERDTQIIPNDLSIWELISLIARCQLTITPDTAIGHIAAAVDTPVCVFYADAHYNPLVWRPMTSKAALVTPSQPGDVNSLNEGMMASAFATLLSQ